MIAQNASSVMSVVRQREKCLGLLWFSLYTAFEKLARGRIKFLFGRTSREIVILTFSQTACRKTLSCR